MRRAVAPCAPSNAADEHIAKGDTTNERIAQAIAQWTASGAYREHNLTLSVVARQMHVPVKQLQLWLRHSEYGNLATLVNRHRIEEAKRVLSEHPDWTIDSVADHCGFNDRKYLHRLFSEQTGSTPAKYQENMSW